jgi:glycine cleavage system aminomethyltransferase T
VTSGARSRVLDKSIMLAWLYAIDDRFADEVAIDGRTARRVPLPFYDPEHTRARG